jgi:hypothetical protein
VHPYHAPPTATGRNRRQRFWLVEGVFRAFAFATGCHRLRPLCSINAPSSASQSRIGRWVEGSQGPEMPANPVSVERGSNPRDGSLFVASTQPDGASGSSSGAISSTKTSSRCVRPLTAPATGGPDRRALSYSMRAVNESRDRWRRFQRARSVRGRRRRGRSPHQRE